MAKKKILIVDDEESLLSILSTRLKYAGFDVETAISGELALDMARAFAPHLVLLDIMMPGIDGFTVLSMLKNEKKTRSIVIVMLTSKGDQQAIERALSMGAVDYIVKPFNPARLVDKVKKALKIS
ncbi:MAG: response regulator [bacterium]